MLRLDVCEIATQFELHQCITYLPENCDNVRQSVINRAVYDTATDVRQPGLLEARRALFFLYP